MGKFKDSVRRFFQGAPHFTEEELLHLERVRAQAAELAAKPTLRNSDYEKLQDVQRGLQAATRDFCTQAESTVSELNDELRKVQRKIDVIANTLPDIIFTLNGDGQILTSNQAALSVFGVLAESQLVGQSIDKFIGGNYAAKVSSESNRFVAFRDKASVSCASSCNRSCYNDFPQDDSSFVGRVHSVVLDKPDGNTLHLEVNANLVNPDDRRESFVYVVVCRDVTQRVKAERQVSDLMLFQQALLNSLPVPAFYTDAAYNITWANPHFVQLFGERVGKPIADVFPAHIPFFVSRQHETSTLVATIDVCGTFRDLIVNTSTIFDSSGTAVGKVCTVQDTTELNAVMFTNGTLERDIISLTESSPDVILIHSYGRLERENEAAKALSPEQREQFEVELSALGSALMLDKHARACVKVMDTDGDTRMYDVMRVMVNSDRILTMGRDVTELTEATLQYDALANAVNALPSPMFVCDSSLRLLFVNSAFCERYGGSYKEYVGCLLDSVLSCPDGLVTLSCQGDVTSALCTCISTDGKPAQLTARNMRGSDGTLYYIGVLHDESSD